MRGIVENQFASNAFIRDLDQWERWYAHVHDCVDDLPEPGAIVTFTPDRDFPRGLRAVAVVVVKAPAPDEDRVCVACGDTFTLTANDQAWFRTKRYPRPSRCKYCRAARRSGAA